MGCGRKVGGAWTGGGRKGEGPGGGVARKEGVVRKWAGQKGGGAWRGVGRVVRGRVGAWSGKIGRGLEGAGSDGGASTGLDQKGGGAWDRVRKGAEPGWGRGLLRAGLQGAWPRSGLIGAVSGEGRGQKVGGALEGWGVAGAWSGWVRPGGGVIKGRGLIWAGFEGGRGLDGGGVGWGVVYGGGRGLPVWAGSGGRGRWGAWPIGMGCV